MYRIILPLPRQRSALFAKSACAEGAGGGNLKNLLRLNRPAACNKNSTALKFPLANQSPSPQRATPPSPKNPSPCSPRIKRKPPPGFFGPNLGQFGSKVGYFGSLLGRFRTFPGKIAPFCPHSPSQKPPPPRAMCKKLHLPARSHEHTFFTPSFPKSHKITLYYHK